MGILSLGLAVVSTVAQMSAARKQARAQREARAISTAGQDIQDNLGRRKAAREERIRRARLISGASASGALGSAGLFGSLGALRSNTDQAIATQTGESLAAKGISAANQRAADAHSKLLQWQAFSSLVSDISTNINKYNEV